MPPPSAARHDCQFPCLRGPGVKAANTRAGVSFAVHLSQELSDGSVLALRIRGACEGLDGYLQVIYGGGIFLGREELIELERCVRLMNRSYMWLAQNAVSLGQCRFAVVPKHHYMNHLMLQARLVNPRFVQTYKGESLVGRGCSLFRASMNGPCRRTVQRTVLCRYVLAFEISSQLRLPQLETK